jgi:hypothetical protein
MTGGGPGPRPEPRSNCASLRERTTLNSVDPAAVNLLHAGTILDVRANSPTGPLVAVLNQVQIVGSVTSASAARILECIEDGYEFVAEVLQVNGGQVVVLIRPR